MPLKAKFPSACSTHIHDANHKSGYIGSPLGNKVKLGLIFSNMSPTTALG